jgi:urease accessory protein
VPDVTALLTALQFGDGQFPGGGFAFSWGLESLLADHRLSRADFPSFVAGQLRHRWASVDRVITAHAHAAAADPARLLTIDDLTDATLTAEPTRAGSRRAGAALLDTHARLGTPGAAALKRAIDAGAAFGHLAVVQGAMLSGVGLDTEATQAISATGMVQAFCTAALRLGLIGHLDAQRTLAAVRPCIARHVATPLPPLAELHGFTPAADIAAMRHTQQPQRLFSN